MNIKIRSIADKGTIQKERITMKVHSNCNVGDYMLMRTGYANGEVTIDIKDAYWFPYKEVSAGDLIVLYTKRGKQSEKPLKKSGTVHFFYWNIDAAIWRSNKVAAVLLHAPTWDSKSSEEL
jgi:hydrogenase maturation factor